MSFANTVPWHPMGQPAYHAVPARQTLRPPPMGSYAQPTGRISRFDSPAQAAPPPPPPPPPSSQKSKIEYGNGVREYVQRTMAEESQLEGVSQDEATEKLKEIIQTFAQQGIQNSIDWSNYPLPQQLILAERNRASLMSSPYSRTAPAYSMPEQHPSSYAAISPPQSQSSRKRKSAGEEENMAAAAEENLPPWRKTNKLEDRMTKKEKRQKKNSNSISNAPDFDSSKFQADVERRRKRFQADDSETKASRWDLAPRIAEGPVIGLNEEHFKPYFRLTSVPDPNMVRPQRVLEETLELLKKKWMDEQNYDFIKSQFKSMRQDLTVQHVRNTFTVRVYETHARIALEKGDLGEYNQCQTQLRPLYAQGIDGKADEFLAYRILYFVYTCNKSDMNDLLAELTPANKKQPFVKHALDVRSALAVGNYFKFFKLYDSAPNLGGFLMDKFIGRERILALANMSRAYMNVPLSFVASGLAFESVEQCGQFFVENGAQAHLVQKEGEVLVNFKGSAQLFENLRAAAFRSVDLKGQL